ncbi:Na(+)/H(+) antiporter subunit C [Naasia sp. SYSU D00057]|uniref:Na(+)/H(+) antiporter subunit C n=1 Tax=Naasia sp. SYSU D00057 TaxID=2817380 RepID=UPI001B3039C6|nr:Na(+)/H(+) antiporter subunit C [Naasia sp. SYSU D00057]
MTASLVLVGVMAVLYACGVYLLLEKSMTRVILGVLLLGNATNLLLLIMSGPSGAAPIVDGEEALPYSDPVPQALILTAIVITFAVSAFLLALVYRSWRLAKEDEVQLDDEDVAIGTRETQPAEAPDRGEPDSSLGDALDDEAEASAADPALADERDR